MEGACINVSELRKRYHNVNAVDGISFDVPYGRVFGFLGPNGAGKTTTIKVLTTLVNPTSGSVRIFGKDIVETARRQKKGQGAGAFGGV
jgi:ABC-2 type transport system ATP-binding protein